MTNVYVEPQPKGRPEGSPIAHYTIESAGGNSIDGEKYSTQEDAINAAIKAGHNPLVARVRNTDKGKPDHWRSA